MVLSDDMRPVCYKCFDDGDLVQIIKAYGGQRGCSFCGRKDAGTIPLRVICEHIHSAVDKNYSKAVDCLPHESAEGGYQGWTSDTYDLLFETIGLELPRDAGDLRTAIADQIGDDVWCEYDWLVLDHDASLVNSWQRFCSIVTQRRRFFFHDIGAGLEYDQDSRSPLQFLNEVCRYADSLGLIKAEPSGYRIYRARERPKGVRYTSPSDLGPPPSQFALQSNRMNPPGIPMLYGADRVSLAIAETRAKRVSIGHFEMKRETRLLDLANLPAVPGFFSESSREKRLTIKFLWAFANEIIRPVQRNDRVNIEYIPTQVFTEFLRDYPFPSGVLDGVRYRSATGIKGTNVVLFAEPCNVVGTDSELTYPQSERWLVLNKSTHK